MRAGFAEGRLTEITKLIGELFEAVAVLVHGHLALVEAVVLGFDVDGASHLVVEEDAMDVTPDEELLALIDLPMEPERSQLGQIDPRRARFPCCIVWTPIPFITWLVPFIGHIGICREDGVILDFAGPYFISVDNFAFGAVARYIQVNGDECYKLLEPEGEATWDDALKKGTREFQDRNYNLFTCNCHSFVANNLNRLFYSGHDKWNVVSLATVMFLQGRWVSTASMVKTFLPSVILIIIGTLLGGTTFLIGLLAFASVMTGWFLIGTYCIKGLIEL